jgi:MFS transporter, DHA3 family, macrolide efflux protein
MRSMISRAMMPFAFLLAGPIADYIFEPLMQANGSLANTFIGATSGHRSWYGVWV